MRADMHKIIVEEPRHGGDYEKNYRRANLPDEQLPQCEGMRRPYRSRKVFGEHLGPLKRWLQSKVGRCWNDIYSEACEVIKPDNVVRAHIRTHMLEMVIQNTFMRNGEVWCFYRAPWRSVKEMPVAQARSRWCLFYVHPVSNMLKPLPPKPRQRSWSKILDERFAQTCRWIAEDIVLVRVRGLWFQCKMNPIVRHSRTVNFDRILKLNLCSSHAWEVYGKSMFCIEKRQLSSEELRKYGLQNAEDTTLGIHSSIGSSLLERIANANDVPKQGPDFEGSYYYGSDKRQFC